MAAGLGTRMKSGTPKVLHRLCGRPMLAYVLDAWAEAVAELGDGTDSTPQTLRRQSSSTPRRPRP